MTPADAFLLLLVLGLFAGILSGIPAMLAIAGVPLVTGLIAAGFGAFDPGFLKFFPARVWGIMLNPLLMAVPLFVLMGVLLERARLAEAMLGTLAAAMGGSARGMGLAVLLFSALLAAATGIVGATVVMLVLVALAPMRAAGIPAAQAAGLITACGTLGQIIPPSVLLVLLGDQIGHTYREAQTKAGNFAPDAVSVGDLFAGALLPGLLLVGLYALWLLITLPRNRAPRLGPGPGLRAVLASFAPTFLLILAVLGSILGGIATTTEAAGLGAIGALLLAGHAAAGPQLRRIIAAAGLAALALVALRVAGDGRPVASGLPLMLAGLAAAVLVLGTLAAGARLVQSGLLPDAATETVRISGMVFGIVIAASLLALVFRGLGGEHEVARLMAALPGGEYGALLAILLIVFVLGFILEAIEIIYIVVPLLGPAVLGGDISPVWFGVLLAMNLQTSFLTPPFGFALFYFRSAAPADISTTALWRGVAPFVLLQVIALGIVVAWPDLATWLPRQIFG